MIENLPERRASLILEGYEGSNDYICQLKKKYENKKSYKLTRSQCDYIISFHEVEPKIAKKWVDLDPYFSKKMMDDKLLTRQPEKIYIEKLLVQKDKSYHILAKLFESEKLSEFWLPKGAIKKKEKQIEKINYDSYQHRPPLEHQKKAIECLVANDKFILADDMGLGKTTSTVIASIERKSKKTLIICPASLKINWKREIENYTDKTISIIEGKKWVDSDYVILNYDILKNFHDPKKSNESIILSSEFDLVIMDEAHYIQNKKHKEQRLRMILLKK